jgi:tetratricopeptide (TPR) repeat protein
MTKPNNPRQRPRTEFRVPPPLLQRTSALGFSGLDLLEDESGIARLVFWRAFRDVELWARAPTREDLFRLEQVQPRTGELNELDPTTYGAVLPHLTVLLDLIREPAGIDPDSICSACSAIGAWFEDRGRLQCAVDFALAAYLTVPRRASLAVRAARLLRMLAEYPRSISWFDYGIYLARKSEDWQVYAEALAGLGNLHFQRGNYPRARLYHRRCLRVASRKHLREMAGAAYHNLFVLEMEAGQVEVAEALAAKALAAYEPTSPSLVRLARDLSHRWTVLGDFARALPLALESLNHFTRQLERAQVWADIGRASGGAGELAIFEDAWIETWTLVKQGVTAPFAADVLLDLAHGAASLGDARRAAHAANKALEIARERKQCDTIFAAEALLDSLHLKPSVPNPITSFPSEQLPGLAMSILRALQELRAAAA